MLGRGMVADPGLALAILAAERGGAGVHTGAGGAETPMPWLSWEDLLDVLQLFWHRVEDCLLPRQRAGRMKQWLNYLRRSYPQAAEAYLALRTENDSRRLADALFGARPQVRGLPARRALVPA